MLDRFVLWWSRTWVLWCLAFSLVFVAVPIKTYQVCFEAATGEALWRALAQDMDVGASVEEQAQGLMELVPVDELKGLEPMLGPDRTQEILSEAEAIRDGLAQEIGSATSESIDKVVGESIPRFLMGEDLTGQQLSRDLQLDLRPVRKDLEIWLTRAGRLIVDAVAEAVQAEIRSYMAPAAAQMAEGVEFEELRQKLLILEGTFEIIRDTMQGVGALIEALETAGVMEDDETAKAAQQLTQTLEILAEIGITAVQKGHEVLAQVDPSQGPPDWDAVVDQVTAAMVDDVVLTAKVHSDAFARDLTQTVVGNGTYALPQGLQVALVQQLRPFQVVMAPMVYAGRALNTVLLALLWSMALMLVLTAGRTRRIAFWTGGVAIVVGAMGSATARVFEAMAMAMAEGLGAVGEAVADAGKFISRMLRWAWGVAQWILDMEPMEIGDAMDGWTTQDVLQSATYGVFTTGVTDRLHGFAASMIWLALFATAIWALLVINEFIARRRPPAAPGTLLAILQQPGGMRMEDPLLFLVPRRGTPVAGALPHAAPSRLLARGLFVDMSWLLLSYLGMFALIGLSAFIALGPAGAGAIVTGLSALCTCMLMILGLLILRLVHAGGRTVSGALAGETLVDAAGQTQPWRLRALRALAPWLGAVVLGGVLIFLTESALLSIGLTLGLLFASELSVIVMSGGTRTLGAMLMGLHIQPGAYGITASHRERMISLLTKAGTVWSLLWGLCTIWFFGLGLYSLISGIITLVFWILTRGGRTAQLRVRLTGFIRLGNWLSLDFIGMGLGIASLWLLADADPSALVEVEE